MQFLKVYLGVTYIHIKGLPSLKVAPFPPTVHLILLIMFGQEHGKGIKFVIMYSCIVLSVSMHACVYTFETQTTTQYIVK